MPKEKESLVSKKCMHTFLTNVLSRNNKIACFGRGEVGCASSTQVERSLRSEISGQSRTFLTLVVSSYLCFDHVPKGVWQLFRNHHWKWPLGCISSSMEHQPTDQPTLFAKAKDLNKARTANVEKTPTENLRTRERKSNVPVSNGDLTMFQRELIRTQWSLEVTFLPKAIKRFSSKKSKPSCLVPLEMDHV